MIRNAAGDIIAEEWQKTGIIRPCVDIDEWIIMPDHLHGIIHIKSETTHRVVSTTLSRDSIGSIIAQFKSVCSKRIKSMNPNFTWQPGYYDHVIRGLDELNRIRVYIVQNTK